jgi:rhodanese-related sulfurtransferase
MSAALAPTVSEIRVTAPAPAVPKVDPLTVEQWRRAGTAVIIDVREKDEFEEERIPGALLFPKSGFDSATFPRFGDLKLVIVCLASKRSLAVGETLRAAGRTEGLSLQGGMLAWMAAGLPVETREK